MKPLKTQLLSTTVIPVLLVAGVAIVTVPANTGVRAAQHTAANPCAAKNPCAARNPCAAKRGCNPCAARNPCNPCAAKNPCNPCAAKNTCNPCNPCAAGGGLSQKCFVLRLQVAAKGPCNPCAARNPCNPCAAKRGCNPCAAKNPCNPCGARNPCAAKRGCNPCAAKNPCNPCGARNPCAAKRGCNPCAAKNPCNPCGAKNPCNPCNPCGAGAAVKLTAAEAGSVYNCLRGEMKTAYGKSGNKYAGAYAKWTVFSKQPYVSGTHGGRFVSNYANAAGKAYGRYEKSGRMPKGAVLAKDSFAVTATGRAGLGPLFLMEKMGKGWHPASGDWRYTLILPSGKVVGTTDGKGAKSVQFCIGCHITVAQDQDSMFFLPQEARR